MDDVTTELHPDRWNMLIQDEDCHWYVIAETEKQDFERWEQAMILCEEWDGKNFDECRIDGPHRFRFRGYREDG